MYTYLKKDLNITPFDSNYLKLLRIAQKFDLASEEVVIINEDIEQIEFDVIDNVIIDSVELEQDADIINRDELIITSYMYIKNLKSDLDIKSFVLKWFSVRIDQGIKPDDIYTEIDILYRKVEIKNPYFDINMVDEAYIEYLDYIKNTNTKEKVILREEERIPTQLASFKDSVVSQINYDSVTLITDVETIKDPMDIFNDIILDSSVPIAIYVGGEKDKVTKLYKVYKGQGIEETAPFQSEWLKTDKDNQVIKFQLYTENSSMNNMDKTKFTPAIFHWGLNPMKLEIDVPFQYAFNREKALKLITPLLPDSKFTKQHDTNIKCNFKVLNFKFRDDVFSWLMMNDYLFKQFFNIRETSIMAVTNRRPEYIMKLNGDDKLSFRIENVLSKINEPFLELDGATYLMPEKTQYTEITVECSSNLLIDNFQKIISKLLSKYTELEGEIINEIDRMLEGYADLKIEDEAPKETVKTYIKELANLAPDIFVHNYARDCQREERQPIILNEEQKKEYEKQTFMFNNKKIKRQTMEFPSTNEGKKYTFACVNENNPFPGLVVNRRENKDKYPFVPCCFGKDQSNTYGNEYGVYFRNEEPKEVVEKARIIETNKIAKPSQYGKLPYDLDFFLSTIEKGNWYRQGTILSPNSFLHIIANLYISNYPKTGKLNEKEDFVNKLRLKLIDANISNLNVLKQEMYNFSEEEIYNYMNDSSLMCDPALMFRLVESIFNIQIIVFTVDENDRVKLDSPHHTIAHYRPLLSLNKETIMIFKHTGGESKMDQMPQCELIVKQLRENEPVISDVSSKLIRKLNELFQSTDTIEWNYDPSGNIIFNKMKNQIIDLEEIFDVREEFIEDKWVEVPTKLQGQYVDLFGKLRFFNYNNFTILVSSPNRPFNTYSIGFSTVHFPNFTKVFDFVKQMTANNEDGIHSINVDENNKIIGIWWYKYENVDKNLLFCPCSPSVFKSKYNDIPINKVEYPSILLPHNIELNEYNHLERVKYILVQLLEFLFLLGPHNYEDIDDFMENYLVVKPDHIYQTKNINKYFPNVKTRDDAVNEFQRLNLVPTFFENGKLILDGPELVSKIRSHLYVYTHKIEGLNLPIPKVMSDFYRNISDFTQYPNHLIFNNYDKILAWITNLKYQDKIRQVIDKITEEYYNMIEPFILHSGKGYYLIQNVKDGNENRAFNVANTWIKKGVNKGFEAREVNISDNYDVLQINKEGDVNIPNEELNILLIEYPNKRYAAVLPLTLE